MNNFFLNQDPLLSNQQYDKPTPIMFQQPLPNIKDSVGELDRMLKGLSPAVLNKLNSNTHFNSLNNSFQSSVQNELLVLVRNKLNMNSEVVSNINEQMRIIEEVKREVESEKEESINEMNDYMKNYSHLTFDEYKKLKNGEPLEKDKHPKRKVNNYEKGRD